ncbi:NAD(P)-binding protein [Microthyrium microscopicum]|uniref:NAD(P)-binding protein n=1 Tax=Microthyrium microscopicum TaxID=703497 RepID=A0A6A6ULP9_9PEZI|nr:NAD(P)-binding protein [Microthyrium microscopicum]
MTVQNHSQNMRTQALVVEKAGSPFVLQEILLDEVRNDEVLVEMKYSGLCHTDIVAQHGLMPVGGFPAVLGHEGAGVIRMVGKSVKNKSLEKGKLVLLSFNSCQKCSSCVSGLPGNCPSSTEINFAGTRKSDGSHPAKLLDGTGARGQFFGQSSFSKLAVVHENSVVPCDVSEESLAMMAPLGCGYQTGAGTVLNVLKPTPTTRLAVFGMGAVGCAALLAAKSLGVTHIIAVDILPGKLEFARSLGATETINTGDVDDICAAFAAIGGVEHIIETTGISKLIAQGIKALSHAGKMALVGVPRPDMPIDIDPLNFLMSTKTLVGVIEGQCNPPETLPQLIQLYQQGHFPIDKLGKVYDVQNIEQALEDLKAGTVIKPILSWNSISDTQQ